MAHIVEATESSRVETVLWFNWKVWYRRHDIFVSNWLITHSRSPGMSSCSCMWIHWPDQCTALALFHFDMGGWHIRRCLKIWNSIILINHQEVFWLLVFWHSYYKTDNGHDCVEIHLEICKLSSPRNIYLFPWSLFITGNYVRIQLVCIYLVVPSSSQTITRTVSQSINQKVYHQHTTCNGTLVGRSHCWNSTESTRWSQRKAI